MFEKVLLSIAMVLIVIILSCIFIPTIGDRRSAKEERIGFAALLAVAMLTFLAMAIKLWFGEVNF